MPGKQDGGTKARGTKGGAKENRTKQDGGTKARGKDAKAERANGGGRGRATEAKVAPAKGEKNGAVKGTKNAKRSGREAADLPSTLLRSSQRAQDTWLHTHDAAVETYGEGERAHRTAFSSLKHSFEKVGDHWEPKEEKGPSDDQAARGGAAAREGGGTAGGVDANASKAHLLDLAKRLDVAGRYRMTKAELVEALDRANRRETARARRGS